MGIAVDFSVNAEMDFYEKRFYELHAKKDLTDQEFTEYQDLFDRVVAYRDKINSELDEEIAAEMKQADDDWEKINRNYLKKSCFSNVTPEVTPDSEEEKTFFHKKKYIHEKIYKFVNKFFTNLKIFIVYQRCIQGQDPVKRNFFIGVDHVKEYVYDIFYKIYVRFIK